MSIFTRLNGTWKEIEQPYSKVDGQIKLTDMYTRVDGKPRLVFGKLTSEDIIGFLLVYYVKEDAEYIDLPDLRYNPNLPIIMTTTSGADKLNFDNKGVVYEYTDKKTDQEGILMYEGRLLAMLKNGMFLDIFGNPDLIPNLDAPLVTKSIDFTVVVSYDVRYQGYGHHVRGWNSMWSSNQFMKPDSDSEEVFELDVRSTANHALVPSGDANACKEWRAVGLKNLSYERALEMVSEVLHLPDNTDMYTYAPSHYPEPDVQCPGRRNDYISYKRALEIWERVKLNRDEEYNDGLFIRICQNLGVNIEEEDIQCSIYGKCKLGYLTYRAAIGEGDCQELANMHWPSMSMKHASTLMDKARVYRSLSPDIVADELFDPEAIYCSGRDNSPISYKTAYSLFNAVLKKKDQVFDNELVYVIMEELGITDTDECSIYGRCVYDDVSYNQAVYWRSCDTVDVETDDDIIPEDTAMVCEIGIARSLHTEGHHMQGARGAMSQNIYSIKLDGIEMPFTVKVI